MGTMGRPRNSPLLTASAPARGPAKARGPDNPAPSALSCAGICCGGGHSS